MTAESFSLDPVTFGHRLRHWRHRRGLTLAQLADLVDRTGPYLSQLENARREPKLSVLRQLADALDVEPAELLAAEPPNHRAALEIRLARAQDDPLYRSLGLPRLEPSARVPDDVLAHLLTIYDELRRHVKARSETPEDARKHNAALRIQMRERDNYFADIETVATEVLDTVGYPGSGAVSPRVLSNLARHFGFAVHAVPDLPVSVRSVTDLKHHRIYIPQRDELQTRVARSVVLQTLGHFALGHEDPPDFGAFLRQRVEANYFAGAVLVPERAAVTALREAKRNRDLSVEDLEELFYVSYEMAAHRLTNLATRHLGLPVHFVRSDEDGIIWKAYENDGVPFPTDPDGAIEGQRLCRKWGTRQVFRSANKFSLHYQYTDTPAGTFWCATWLEAGAEPAHAVTIGVPFGDAQYFRGRDTSYRSESACPQGPCCRQPDDALIARWEGMAWPSPRPHSHVLAAMPAGTFPGVDLTDVYEFLDRQPSR